MTPEEIRELVAEAQKEAGGQPSADGKPITRDLGPGEAALRSVGRVGWSIPGVLGLDNARAQAIGEWVTSRMRGGPTVDVEARTAAGREQNKLAEQQHPLASLAGGLPANAALAALTAPLTASRAVLSAGPAASAAAQALSASLQSLGETQGYDPASRAVRSGVAGATAAPFGAMAPPVATNAGRVAASKELGAAQKASGGDVTGLPMGDAPEDMIAAILSRSGKGSMNEPTPPIPPAGAASAPPLVAPSPSAPAAPGSSLVGVPGLPEEQAIAAARWLQARGVNVTKGQQNPRGSWNMIEEASTKLPMTGPVVRGQREAAVRGWQNLAVNSARAPGTPKVAPSGSINADVQSLADGYGKAYGAIRGGDVYPAVHGPGGGPLQSMGDTPGLVARTLAGVKGVADSARNEAVGFVEDALTKLPERQGAVGRVTAGDLMDVRSLVRTEARDALRANNMDRAKLYDAAEDVITAALESQLPAKVGAALKSVDSTYRNFKMLERAIIASGDSPSGFTPHQLSLGVKAAVPPGEFARGGGGPMRELAQVGRIVFEQQTPQTGAMGIVLGGVPKFLLDPLVGVPTALANRAPKGGSAPSWSPPAWSTTTDWFKD